MTDPVVFQAAPEAPEAQQQQPAAPAATSLEESLMGLDEQTRNHVLSEIRVARNEARNLRERVKEAEPILAQWHALEQASKTEFEQVQEDLERTKRDAEKARAEAIRYKVAATHGIPADDFDLLGSGTEEEIAARAQRLAAYRAAAEQAQQPVAPTAPQRRPVEQLRPGATPADAESEQDVLYASLFGKQ
jgi:hypothetical protein